MDNLTSELSSLRSCKNSGRMCSFVAVLPIRGHRVRMLSARAILTYWKVSVASGFNVGATHLSTSFASITLQNSFNLLTAAVRTSDSVSCKNEM